jgi:hypothetical protein
MRTQKNTQGKGESMAEKGNENGPEATEKTKGVEEGPAHEEAARKSPESGPMGGDEDPGHAPMGGGDQRHNTKAGSKVEEVGDEKDPSGDSDD